MKRFISLMLVLVLCFSLLTPYALSSEVEVVDSETEVEDSETEAGAESVDEGFSETDSKTETVNSSAEEVFEPTEEVNSETGEEVATETEDTPALSEETSEFTENGATSGACGDNLHWSLTNGVLTISGTGEMDDYDGYEDTSTPWGTSIKKVVIESGVTSIGDYAFSLCTNLTSVTIPNSVTSIGNCAFSYCDGLTQVTIPNSVTSIGEHAFGGCDNLTSINIPSKVTNIGASAFASCDSLTSITIPGGVETIENSTFIYCKSLTSVTFSNGVSTVGPEAFLGCTKLTSITVPKSMTFIGPIAFEGCSKLTDIYYVGSKSDWQNVSIESSNRYILNATIHYDSTDPDAPKTLLLKDQTFHYYSEVSNEEVAYLFDYDESLFLTNGYTYQHELAKTSMAMSLAACQTTSKNIKSMLETMEYTIQADEFVTPSVVVNDPSQDTIGYIIGTKSVLLDGTEYTLVAVVIRSGGYLGEWSSNVTVGASGDHKGFSDSADKVVAAVKKVLAEDGDANYKIWMTGYSRGAAVANVAAYKLDVAAYNNKIQGLTQNNIYAYCFECPQTTTDTNKGGTLANNIISIVNYNDFVTKVAMSSWGFGRYGTTYYLPDDELCYNGYSGAQLGMWKEYKAILSLAGIDSSDAKVIWLTTTSPAQGSQFEINASTIALCLSPRDVSYVNWSQPVLRDALKNGTSGVLTIKGMADLVIALSNPLGATWKAAYFCTLNTALTNLGVNALFLAHAHYPELCLSWVNSLDGSNYYVGCHTRCLAVNCPVDVSVYDSQGKLVASIVGDEVQEIEDGIAAYIDANGQKMFVLPEDEEFRIVSTATDDGTMSYQITEKNIDTDTVERVVNYFDLPIEEGDEITGIVEEASESESCDYPLYTEDGSPITPDEDCSGEEISSYILTISTEGNGSLEGGGLFTQGAYAQVTATADDGYAFTGWYSEGDFLNGGSEYRFRMEKDLNLEALFCIAGDINGDEKVNLLDAVKLLKRLMNENTEVTYSDVNSDGETNVMDVLHLVKLLVGAE